MSKAIGRKQLAEFASSKTGIASSDAYALVGAFVEGLVHHLSLGNRIELRGFASFSTRIAKGRVYGALPKVLKGKVYAEGDSAYEKPSHKRLRAKFSKSLALKVAQAK